VKDGKADIAVFASVFNQLLQQKRLYIDLFDNKDPLFYFFYTLFLGVFQDAGPAIWETVLIIGNLILFVILISSMKVLRPIYIFLMGITFIYLNYFFVYRPYFPYLQTLLFLLISILLILKGKAFLGGLFFALSITTRLTVLFFYPSLIILLIVIYKHKHKKILLKVLLMMLGTGLGLTLVCIILLFRGEFWGYIDIIRYNLFIYPKNIIGYYDLPIGFIPFVTKTAKLFSWGFVLLWAIVFLFIIYILVFKNHNLKQKNPTFLAILSMSIWFNIGGAIYLSTGFFWPHYFQLLFFSISLNMTLVLCHFAMTIPNSKYSFTFWILSFTIIFSSGFLGKSYVTESINNFYQVKYFDFSIYSNREDSLEACLLGDIRLDQIDYAVVARNSYKLVPAFSPDNLQLSCKCFYQLETFEEQQLLEFYTCLSREPDIVFTYPESEETRMYLDSIEGILQANFTIYKTCDDINVWVRK
jgi:hypothetical protein